MTTTGSKRLLFALVSLMLAACSGTPAPDVHPGIFWVRNAAEFEAVALQVYRAAGDALAAKLEDRTWSALPDQQDAGDLPPAIIFDVDETVVSNAEFQLTLVPPFADRKLNAWNETHVAVPVPGVVEFARQARSMGVELFFVTNRPCIPDEMSGHPCPQKAVTTEDISEAGIPVGEDRVMLSFEQPGWNKEKKNRRDVIAAAYRVIMLVGDDLGDFIPCSRRRAVAPCEEGATAASRARATQAYRDYWGNGWYILPNPMHGSWTSAP